MVRMRMRRYILPRNMREFSPDMFDFVPLRDFRFPGGILVFEYKNHAAVNGQPDFLRLNLYLSKDDVTVWFGLLEPMSTESKVGAADIPDDFNFRDAYNEELFKGYIESEEAAMHILKALRIGTSHVYATPQTLSIGSDNALRCDVMR
jgi:hypothetical protein